MTQKHCNLAAISVFSAAPALFSASSFSLWAWRGRGETEITVASAASEGVGDRHAGRRQKSEVTEERARAAL